MLKEVLVLDKSYSINFEGQAKNLKIVVMRLDFAYRATEEASKRFFALFFKLLSSLTLSKSLQRSRRTASSSSGQCCKNLMG